MCDRHCPGALPARGRDGGVTGETVRFSPVRMGSRVAQLAARGKAFPRDKEKNYNGGSNRSVRGNVRPTSALSDLHLLEFVVHDLIRHICFRHKKRRVFIS
jgi:hypothetical protein